MKKVLFVTNATGIGGSEQVLKTILKRLDKEKYSVSLLSINDDYNSDFINLDIQAIPRSTALKISVGGLKKSIHMALKNHKATFLTEALKYKFLSIIHHNRQHEVDWWRSFSKSIEKLRDSYDVAIAFGAGMTIPYVIEKVNAHHKIVWVNFDVYKMADLYTKETEQFYQVYYQMFFKIVTVSRGNRDAFLKKYRDLNITSKVELIMDLIDKERIYQLAESSIDCAIYKRPIILTVGRFSIEKGYRLLISAASILNNKGYLFNWLIIGNGDTNEYSELIKQKQVSERIHILGSKENPYPYFKMCDFYVQTSLNEGNCLTLIEALLFKKPCVTTNFPTGVEKIKNGINGIVVDMTPESIAHGVEKMIINPNNIRKKYAEAISLEEFNTDEEIKKIYRLLDSNENE